jgi:hypothetical protein
VTNEILDGTDMVGQIFGERQRFAHQTRNALPQRVGEACEVIRFASFLGDRFVSLRRNHPGVSVILVRMKRGLFPVYQRDLGPEYFGTIATPIADVKRNHLAGGGVHGDPDPLLVGSLRHETPHLIGFGFQPSKHHVRGTRWNPDIEVIRAGGKAFHHKAQQLRETGTHGAADSAERDALTQQVFDEGAPLVRNASVFGRGYKLTFARLTLMILLAMAGMAIFLIPA